MPLLAPSSRPPIYLIIALCWCSLSGFGAVFSLSICGQKDKTLLKSLNTVGEKPRDVSGHHESRLEFFWTKSCNLYSVNYVSVSLNWTLENTKRLIPVFSKCDRILSYDFIFSRAAVISPELLWACAPWLSLLCGCQHAHVFQHLER